MKRRVTKAEKKVEGMRRKMNERASVRAIGVIEEWRRGENSARCCAATIDLTRRMSSN